MFNGLISLPWWGYLIVGFVLTHITIASVTLYLHRAQAHRALDLHPVVSHFFRFWLWLTTGMITKQWVAIHRKHHAKCEGPEDPHSPHVFGIRKVMWEGAELYRAEAHNDQTMEKFGLGTPDDWMERNIYSRHNFLGVTIMALIDLTLFGAIGLTIWAIQMIWIPFWAAGVINGLGHWWGYRNYEPKDGSTNIVPLGLIIGGEEMHNNHHAFPSSAKFSSKWWEFDIGWFYIRTLSVLRLAKVRKVAPKPVVVRDQKVVDLETVRAVVVGRLHVSSQYAKRVILPVLKDELARADDSCRSLLKRARRTLVREDSRIDEHARRQLGEALKFSERLKLVYDYRVKLQQVWETTHASQEKLLKSLQNWCAEAEASGVRSLQEFANSLRGYRLAGPAPI